MPSAKFDPTAAALQGQAIGNLIMRLLSDYTGRGPTKARTHFNENLITIVVHDLLTKGERSLIRDGKQNLVLETRRAYQQTMGADLTAGIEEITGRQVIAFLSANHLDPDLAIETFVLAPENDGRPPPVEGTPDRTQINDDRRVQLGAGQPATAPMRRKTAASADRIYRRAAPFAWCAQIARAP